MGTNVLILAFVLPTLSRVLSGLLGQKFWRMTQALGLCVVAVKGLVKKPFFTFPAAWVVEKLMPHSTSAYSSIQYLLNNNEATVDH